MSSEGRAVEGEREAEEVVGLLDLPLEILVEVFLRLDLKDMRAAACTCKDLHEVMGNVRLLVYVWSDLAFKNPKSESPTFRRGHCAAFDSKTNRMILVGGYGLY